MKHHKMTLKIGNLFELFHIILCTSSFLSSYRFGKVRSSIWRTLFLIFWSARSDILSVSAKLDSLFWEVLSPSAVLCKPSGTVSLPFTFLYFPFLLPISSSIFSIFSNSNPNQTHKREKNQPTRHFCILHSFFLFLPGFWGFYW